MLLKVTKFDVNSLLMIKLKIFVPVAEMGGTKNRKINLRRKSARIEKIIQESHNKIFIKEECLELADTEEIRIAEQSKQ